MILLSKQLSARSKLNIFRRCGNLIHWSIKIRENETFSNAHGSSFLIFLKFLRVFKLNTLKYKFRISRKREHGGAVVYNDSNVFPYVSQVWASLMMLDINVLKLIIVLFSAKREAFTPDVANVLRKSDNVRNKDSPIRTGRIDLRWSSPRKTERRRKTREQILHLM